MSGARAHRRGGTGRFPVVGAAGGALGCGGRSTMAQAVGSCGKPPGKWGAAPHPHSHLPGERCALVPARLHSGPCRVRSLGEMLRRCGQCHDYLLSSCGRGGCREIPEVDSLSDCGGKGCLPAGGRPRCGGGAGRLGAGVGSCSGRHVFCKVPNGVLPSGAVSEEMPAKSGASR